MGDCTQVSVSIPSVNQVEADDAQRELCSATENLKIEDQKENENDCNKCDKVKIDILLKATGNAPIMKKKKWAVDAEKQIGWIVEFVKKYLKLEPDEKLFVYVNQTFAPAPDQVVRNLYRCFGADGKLVLHYCRSQAWG